MYATAADFARLRAGEKRVAEDAYGSEDGLTNEAALAYKSRTNRHQQSPSAVHARKKKDRKSVGGASGTCPFHCGTEKPGVWEAAAANFIQAHANGLTQATDADSGNPLVWSPSQRNNLTWSCESEDIEEFADDVATAFASWAKACNVVFKKVDSDGFITLRWATDEEEEAGKGVIAAAFFPGEPDRSVKLYKIFADQGPFRLAVLKHEIGHALGFRHEHIWFTDNPTGEQPTEGGLGAELVTRVDRNSIMGYNKLWADQKANRVTDLSRLDKIGARLVYGAPGTVVNFVL